MPSTDPTTPTREIPVTRTIIVHKTSKLQWGINIMMFLWLTGLTRGFFSFGDQVSRVFDVTTKKVNDAPIFDISFNPFAGFFGGLRDLIGNPAFWIIILAISCVILLIILFRGRQPKNTTPSA